MARVVTSLPQPDDFCDRLRHTLLPRPLAGQAVVQADSRLPAEMRAKLRGICERVALIAGPGRLLAGDRLSPGELFQLVDDVPDGGGFAAADVVDLARVGTDGSDGRGHAIGDVSVTSDLLAVAENGDRLLPLHRLNKEMITHVRALPGAIDGEVPQDHDGQSVHLPERPAELLAGEFGDSVRRDGFGRQCFVAG